MVAGSEGGAGTGPWSLQLRPRQQELDPTKKPTSQWANNSALGRGGSAQMLTHRTSPWGPDRQLPKDIPRNVIDNPVPLPF